MYKLDSHVHFDCKKNNPYLDLKERLCRNNIESCVLILNTKLEQEIFWDNFEAIREDKVVHVVAGILDIHESNSLDFFEKCVQNEIVPAVKLHPRLSKITKSDFRNILITLEQIEYENIIIDNFIYGPNIENHIGTELAIYLSQNLKNRKIVLAHSGGCDILKTLLLTRPLNNIYYDYSLTCNYLYNTSVRADMLNGMEYWTNRIMFGTDYPDFDFGESISKMEQMCKEANLSELQKRKIFYDNAMNLYRRSF